MIVDLFTSSTRTALRGTTLSPGLSQHIIEANFVLFVVFIYC